MAPPYKLAGVMGWPVAHSRSPVIHKHWIAEHQLQGDYVLLPVQPNALRQALRSLPLLGFAGCNLTIPHKVAALSLVDHLEPLAQRIGAVNTIVVEPDGSLTGRNSDAYGFVQSLRDGQPGWQSSNEPNNTPALVLGAGGAARAVIAGLLDAGLTSIRISNRSLDNARALVDVFGPQLSAIPWTEREAALQGASLLVNTTNLGMDGQDALELDLHYLSPQALVADVVYTPLETDLLRSARLRGNATVSGLGMLLNQARPAFAAWFGVMPSLSEALLRKIHASFN